MDKLTEEGLKQVLTSLFDSMQSEEVALAKAVLATDGVTPERLAGIKNVEEFFYTLVYPYQKFLGGFVQEHFKGDREAQWLFMHHRYVQRHYEVLIVKHEGAACSVDKSRTIIHELAMWKLGRKERIEWDYSGEYTYHLPKVVFTTHESITEFYDTILALYHGNSEKYLNYIAHKKHLLVP
jgi:hypothetical protein